MFKLHHVAVQFVVLLAGLVLAVLTLIMEISKEITFNTFIRKLMKFWKIMSAGFNSLLYSIFALLQPLKVALFEMVLEKVKRPKSEY